NNTQVDVEDSVTATATVRLVGGGNTLVRNAAPGVTLWLEGNTTQGFSQLTALAGAFNAGTLRMESTSAVSFIDSSSYLTISAGVQLVNTATGVIQSNTGQGWNRTISGYLVNQGLVNAQPGMTTTLTGTLEEAGGTYAGP